MLSVVIPARNAAEHLAACLQSLASQDPAPDEVIVVDDASSDGTAALARAHGARVVALASQQGPGAARNAGFAAAGGDVVAFVDADDVPEPGWAAAIQRAFDAGAALVNFPFRNTGSSALAIAYVERTWNDGPVWQPRWPAGAPRPTADLALRRDVFVAVGGFDASLRACEDLDFQLRAALGGHPALELEGGGVVIGRRRTARALLRQRAHWAYWAEVVAWKYRAFPYVILPPQRLARRAATAACFAVFTLVRGDHRGARLAAIDAAHLAVIGTSRLVGRLDLATGRRARPAPLQPVDDEQSGVGGGLPPGPAAILVGEREATRLLAMALNADRGLSVPPPGLVPGTAVDWAEPAPPPAELVRRALRCGWRLPSDLAARRLGAAHPATLGEAVLTLHAEHAWLTRKPRWILCVSGEAAGFVVAEHPAVPVISADELDGATSAAVVARLSAQLGLASPAVVAAAHRFARIVRQRGRSIRRRT